MKPLPESREELKKLCEPYEMLVNPLMNGLSECLELVGSKRLSTQEIAGGTHAFSAFCAQYAPGKFMDSRFLILIWVAGTLLPRVLLYLRDRKTAEETKKKAELAAAGMVVVPA